MSDGKNGLKACTEFEPLLEDFLDGEQDAAEVQRLKAHLAGCAGCSSALRVCAASIAAAEGIHRARAGAEHRFCAPHHEHDSG